MTDTHGPKTSTSWTASGGVRVDEREGDVPALAGRGAASLGTPGTADAEALTLAEAPDPGEPVAELRCGRDGPDRHALGPRVADRVRRERVHEALEQCGHAGLRREEPPDRRALLPGLLGHVRDDVTDGRAPQ